MGDQVVAHKNTRQYWEAGPFIYIWRLNQPFNYYYT
jgi:hypothetical protein